MMLTLFEGTMSSNARVRVGQKAFENVCLTISNSVEEVE